MIDPRLVLLMLFFALGYYLVGEVKKVEVKVAHATVTLAHKVERELSHVIPH